jgi:hypothetical protein
VPVAKALEQLAGGFVTRMAAICHIQNLKTKPKTFAT